MTREVVVGQQVDKEKEAKEKTKRLVITLVAIGILIFGCIASCLVFGVLAPDAPVVAPTPTRGRGGEGGGPGEVVEPTPVPTPAYLTVARIEQERKALTDIQKEQYDQGILGEVIQFHGQVVEVSEDGKVSIDEGAAFTSVQLSGIPRDVVMTFTKGHLIEGMGTVADVDTFLILMIEIQVTSWNR